MTRTARTATTMLVLLFLLMAAAYFGWVGLTRGWLGDDGGSAATNGPVSCTTPAPETVRSRSMRVSVYNAGAPEGEATEVMDALRDQGFVKGELTDAPEPIEVEGIVLWPGDAERAAVRLVKRQFAEARLADVRRTLGPGVNVLVGEDFDRLARRAPRSLDVTGPRRCAPAG